MINFDLKDRVAIVTGGAQGFGLAITERFIASGASVVIWDIDEEAIKIAIKKINSDKVSYQIVDVGNYENIEKNLAEIEKTHKKIDIFIRNGKIAEISERILISDIPEIDAGGHFISPPFIDSHFHMDATLSYGLPRINQSGTLLEGISLWGELKKDLTADTIKERARKLCKWSIARGTLGIRSHVDVSGDNLMAVESLLDIKEEMNCLLYTSPSPRD